MVPRILVPLDGSSFGEAALLPAVAIARKSGGDLRLMSAHESDRTPTLAAVCTGLLEGRKEYLNRVSRAFFDLRASTIVREGPAETQILEEAAACRADLIVMSTHGRGAVSRFWLGSVADHCLRHARVPVLLVRPRPSGMTPTEALFSPKRLIVPLDGSRLAERALDPALDLARAFSASVALVRVVADQRPVLTMRLAPPPVDPLELENARTESREYLGDVAAELRSRGIMVTTDVLVEPHAAHAIIEHAAGDLVVMATHSLSPFQRALLGSVTDKVVRGTRGSVLAIPAAGGAALVTGPEAALETDRSTAPGASRGFTSVPGRVA